MKQSEITDRAAALVEDAYRMGLKDGLLQGVSRLEMIAAIVPKTVTKQWILDEAGRQAGALRAELTK